MSNTNNVKLGVCHVFFGGVDLGYTQGGVEVDVKTDTHPVNVDQFGKSVINEVVLGRTVSVKVPLAETTLENLVRIMPGAVISTTGGVKATGSVTFSGPSVAGDAIILNGVTYTATAGLPSALTANQFSIGTTPADQATKFAATVNSDEDASPSATATVSGGVVTLTADNYDTAFFSYNTYTLSKTGGATATVSGATLTGGVIPTKEKVTVPTAIGTSLLTIAQQLVLHPQSNADINLSEDFVIPLAATAGALQFAYQLEKERIYNVTFTGYPDSATGTLFLIGDPSSS